MENSQQVHVVYKPHVLRNARGPVSQRQTAARLGISPALYQGYESGRVRPPYETMARILHSFGLTFDDLIEVQPVAATSEPAETEGETMTAEAA